MAKSLNTILIACICSLVTVFLYHSYVSGIAAVNEENYAQLVTQIEDNRSPSVLSRESSLNELSFIEPAAKAKNSVVALESVQIKDSRFEKDKYIKSNGSGVIISPDGYVVTNYHVVEHSDNIKVTLEDKREFKAEMIGYDRSTDIALLKLDVWGLPFLEFGDSDNLEIGEWVLAIGNPFKLSSSVTAGIVSAKARNINIFRKQGIESFIQSDAAINPGNSGGALINIAGELIGINTAILTYSGKYEGFSFAIPSNMVRKVIKDIREYGAVQRAWLGISILSVDESRAESLDLGKIEGVFIDMVERSGAAGDAGLQYEDVIVALDGKATVSRPLFLEIISQYRPGDKIKIDYIRNGEKKSTTAILRNQKNTTDYIAVRKDKLFTDLGFELRDLDSKEKEQNATEGVMVVSIYKDSKIESINMDPGYIITSVNGKDISNIKEFKAILEKAEGEIYLNGIYENYPREWPYKFRK